MPNVGPRMCFADLERMPEDGRRYELYDGELSDVPSPLPRHQRVALNVAERLREYERRAGGLVFVAPLDIVLDEHNVVQPDVVYFTAARAATIDLGRPIWMTPDLVVEVLSPATATNDRGRKQRLLARFGVAEYWLVDPADRTIEQLVLEGSALVLANVAGDRDALASRGLPGLVVSAAEILEE
jgi:Uma2 family endonuclease